MARDHGKFWVDGEVVNRNVARALSARWNGTTLVCGSATPGLSAVILGSFQVVMDPWYISASTLPFSLRWTDGRRPGMLKLTCCAEIARGMLSIAGLVTRSPLDRKASDAPMSTFPAEASAMPLPEPVAAVAIDTLACCPRYAAAQARNSGNSSVLPVSERFCCPGAGPDGMPPPGDAAAASGIEALPVPGLHAAARVSGRTAAVASSRRDLSATDRCSFVRLCPGYPVVSCLIIRCPWHHTARCPRPRAHPRCGSADGP